MNIEELNKTLAGKTIKSVRCIKQGNNRHTYELDMESGGTIVTGNLITTDTNFLCVEGVGDGGCHSQHNV